MDIYTMIKKDHADARQLIEQITNTRDEIRRPQLVKKLKDAVIAHNDSEAGSFYVALEKYRGAKDKIPQSRTEHHEANSLLNTLAAASDMLSPQWESQFLEFQKALFRHIEEEETTVFDKARHVLSPVMAEQLAIVMDDLKHKKEAMLRKAG
jgi:hemerythrin superfamily protein